MDKFDKIESFKVDHTKIVPGIYISRTDGDITTFDLRVKKPNAGDYIDNITMHSVEHMFATYIRNSEIADRVIYFGPMGCQTGFYLLTRGVSTDDVFTHTLRVLEKITAHDGEMFGADETECGNYKNLSVESAKELCAAYLKALEGSPRDFKY